MCDDNEQQQPITKWSCDICGSEVFDSFDEALEHETSCKGKANEEEIQIDEGENVETTVWICDICNSEEFDTFEEAAAHEKICNNGKYVCDICTAACFATYELAFEHEKTCTGINTMTSETKGPPLTIDIPLTEKLPTSPQGLGTCSKSVNSSEHLIVPGTMVPSSKALIKNPNDSLTGRVSPVQSMKRELSRSEDIESRCKKIKTSMTNLLDSCGDINKEFETKPKSNDQLEEETPNEITFTMTTPTISLSQCPGSEESLSYLSALHRLAVMQLQIAVVFSADDSELENGFRHINISCLHCGHKIAPNSIESWHTHIYQMTYSHFFRDCCMQVPHPIRDEIKMLQSIRKKRIEGGSLKIFFSNIAKGFNLVNMWQHGGKCGVGIKYDGPIVNEDSSVSIASPERTASISDRVNRLNIDRMCLSNIEHKSSPSKSMPTWYTKNGTTICLPRSGGVPLISSFSSKKANKLSIQYRLILNQLELSCEELKVQSKPRSAVTCVKRLALRCQNCNANPSSAYMKHITSVEHFDQSIIASREHLTKCKGISKNVQTEIRKSLKSSSSASNRSIKEYCDYISVLFGMVNESEGCVWKD